MIIDYEGQAYHFDQQKIDVGEWRELKRKYRMTPKAFGDGLDEADPDAITFLWWIMLRQNQRDRGLPLGDHLKPDVIALNNAAAVALKAEQEAATQLEDGEPEPDPTVSGSPSPAESPSPPAAPSQAQNPNGTGVSVPATA